MEMDAGRQTERVRKHYERNAGRYDRSIVLSERLLVGDGRGWACAQAAGDVLEIAAGTGRNFPFYPPGVSLTALDVSSGMLELARARAADVGREVDLRLGDAQSLDFASETFDTVVCTFSLCTIPDWRRAVAEAARVLRPGGRFLLVEHVRSPILPVTLVQRLLDPLFVRFDNDHLLREPLEAVRAEGLEVEHLRRSRLGIVERLRARKPA